MGLDNPLHIAFLVVILLLVFGARRLPEIGRSLGSGMREFKTSVTGEMQHPSQTPLAPGVPQQQPAPAQPVQAQQQQPVPVQAAAQPGLQATPVAEPGAAPVVPPDQPPAS
jgi:sec-independent protein translocase protein TatA